MKQKMKKFLLYFFACMLVANVICRVRDTYMVPRVEVANPIRTKLTHSMQTDGYFTSSDSWYLQPQAGWKIGKVFVSPGSQVQERDVLWQYDLAYLNDLYLEKMNALEKQQLMIEQTKMTYASGSEVSEDILALQNLEKATGQVNCEQIWLEEAVAEYEKRIREIEAKYEKKKDLAKQEHNINCSEDLEDTQKALLDTQLSSQIFSLEEEEKEEKKNAYDEIISKNKSLFQAMQDLESAKQKYDNAVITQQETQKQQEKSNKSVTCAIEVLGIEENALEEEIALIKSAIEQEGYVYTNMAGNATNVELVEGHFASGEEKVEIAGVSDTFIFSLPETEVALLEQGDECHIHVAGISRSKDGTIENLQPENVEKHGNWTVTCIQSEQEPWDDCRWNQQGTVSIQKKTQEYNCCVPVEALVCQSGNYYCRVVTEEQTILGKEQVIEEIPVTVVEKDANYAYVTGDIFEESVIVTDYNKAIAEGDRVRVVSRL